MYKNQIFLKSFKLPLLNLKFASKSSKRKEKIKSIKPDCRLFSNLYIASQSRDWDLDNFFVHENLAFPISLSEFGKLGRCTKSDLQESIDKPVYINLERDTFVIDRPAFK